MRGKIQEKRKADDSKREIQGKGKLTMRGKILEKTVVATIKKKSKAKGNERKNTGEKTQNSER